MNPDSSRRPEPAERHRQTAATFTEVVRAVPDERWDSPSPVAGWTARDVLRHLVEWSTGFIESSSEVRLNRGPGLDEDPAGAWEAHRDAIQAILDDPEQASAPVANEHLGEMTVAEAIDTIYTDDIFMHTWDLAKATGQDIALDPHRCEQIASAPPEVEELMRVSGQFGPRVPVSDDASPQDRMAAFIGRDPAWQP
ncbi:maleylpyruvate isomerase family mycothiol-dependent enzyme [Brevibacterium daeguense]|uniref:Maleylpyruvate isomerase family mycothiol-dependent enzyme n=1 Tax=Brevibacterium daeguense TaxID=909936 RepID=A0ABP8EII1_9MICO|nr:TIGR03086 family metal-binding protein [Brevibacterium daeguense]